MSKQGLEARVLQLSAILRNNRIPVLLPAVFPLRDPSPTLHDASIAEHLQISPAPLEESAAATVKKLVCLLVISVQRQYFPYPTLRHPTVKVRKFLPDSQCGATTFDSHVYAVFKPKAAQDR